MDGPLSTSLSSIDILEWGCPLIARSNRFLTYLGHHFKTQLPCMKHIDQREMLACRFCTHIIHMRVDDSFCQGLADCDLRCRTLVLPQRGIGVRPQQSCMHGSCAFLTW